jgi:DeoR family transcriptional regulator of aga operon
MNATERRHEIVQMALVVGKVDVERLVDRFCVSGVTILSDLNALDRMGLLVRTRGGALASTRILRELSLAERTGERSAVKRRIAEAARSLVRDGDALILDSGTTTAEIASALIGFKNLMVMTNGLNVAQNLAAIDGVEVLITGGKLRKVSQSFFGSRAEEAMSCYNFDKVFLGVDGFDFNVGITTHFEYEAILNRRMCEASKQIIAVTDSSKFNQSGVHKIRNFGDIDVLITDSGIPDTFVSALEARGVRLIIVEA